MGRGAHGKTFSLELNKHGFRGATPSIKKSAGTTRIMVIGDSYTAGLDYPDEEIFTQMLESRLNAKNQNYEVINVSCPSWATDQHYLYWTTEGLKYNPDILILMASPNDIRETYNKKIFQLQSDNSLKQNKVWMHWKERTGWWLARHSSLFQYIQKEFLDKKFGTFTNIYKYYPVHYFQEDYKDWDRPIFLKEPFKEVRESYHVKKAASNLAMR